MTGHVLENLQEEITNNYSSYHEAVDIVGEGSNLDNVVAISDGKVEMVAKDFKYTDHNTQGTDTYGNFVKIQHENGKKTLYAHLKYDSVDVNVGDEVSKGQKIGSMGETGNAYGAHLHFEVRNEDETRENPIEYLKGNASLDPAPKVEFKEEATEEVQKEVEPIKNSTTTTYLKNDSYYGGSIVDGLKGIGVDSSYDNRSTIALKNGINDYHGAYDQNVYLLKLLKQGKLII